MPWPANRLALLTCASCSTLLCAGCVIITGGYPKAWSPTLHQPDSCEDELTGTYAMVGEDFTNGFLFVKPESKTARLDKYLMPDSNPDADRIEIVGPSHGRLVFTTEQGDRAIMQRTLIEHHDYECKGDSVSLKNYKFEESHGGGVGSMSWSSERYWRATDGSLIIRRTSIGAGGISTIPIFGSTEDWSKFPHSAQPPLPEPSGPSVELLPSQ